VVDEEGGVTVFGDVFADDLVSGGQRAALEESECQFLKHSDFWQESGPVFFTVCF
jgi:hypothetical protein